MILKMIQLLRARKRGEWESPQNLQPQMVLEVFVSQPGIQHICCICICVWICICIFMCIGICACICTYNHMMIICLEKILFSFVFFCNCIHRMMMDWENILFVQIFTLYSFSRLMLDWLLAGCFLGKYRILSLNLDFTFINQEAFLAVVM